MKKLGQILFVLCFGMSINGFSQTAPKADFFAGKWGIWVVGSPRGDVKFETNLVRKEGQYLPRNTLK